MKKIVILFIVFTLLITGCGTKVQPKKMVNHELYNYSVSQWKNLGIKQDKVINDIIDIWESNNEKYNVNFEVNLDTIKSRIDEYSINNPELTFFELASKIVGIDYHSYSDN